MSLPPYRGNPRGNKNSRKSDPLVKFENNFGKVFAGAAAFAIVWYLLLLTGLTLGIVFLAKLVF